MTTKSVIGGSPRKRTQNQSVALDPETHAVLKAIAKHYSHLTTSSLIMGMIERFIARTQERLRDHPALTAADREAEHYKLIQSWEPATALGQDLAELAGDQQATTP